MLISGDFALLIVNGVFTTLCGFIIVYFMLNKRLISNFFYYSWAIGFFIYGIEIFLRAAGVPYFCVEALVFVSFIFFAAGIFYLSRARFLLYELGVFSLLSIVFVSLFLSELISYIYLAAFGGTIIYLFVAAAILRQRQFFGTSAEKLAIGWFLLYFTNIFLVGMGGVTDVFAIFAKVMILLGLLDYDFIVISKKARENRFPPLEAGFGLEGGFKILLSGDNSNAILREGNWVKKKVVENLKQGSDTIVCVFQDVVPYKELRAIKWLNPERVSVYLFSSSAQKVKSEFTVIPMGLAQIGAALSQVTKQCKSSENGCTVIFFHLSLLIHLYGAEAVHVMLLNKMGYLREHGISLYAIFYPSMHGDQSVVSLFTRLADEIIKL